MLAGFAALGLVAGIWDLFELLFPACTVRLADTRLDRLTCVVFDSETTGLNPRQGDETVQHAAVRIVNGCRVEGQSGEGLELSLLGRLRLLVGARPRGVTKSSTSLTPRRDRPGS